MYDMPDHSIRFLAHDEHQLHLLTFSFKVPQRYKPAQLYIPSWLHAFLLVFCIGCGLFTAVVGDLNVVSAAALDPAKLPISVATNTLPQFLKQGTSYKPFDGMHVASAGSPLLKTSTDTPAASTIAKTQLPSAEPPDMKVASGTIPASYVSAPVASGNQHSSVAGGSTSAMPALHLSGSDGNGVRLEVAIPAGALDFSAAKTTAGAAPQGNLSITLTQTRGHYLTDTTELGSFQLSITDAKGQVVQDVKLRIPLTYTFHYRARELSNLGIDPKRLYLVLTPVAASSTKSATKTAVVTPAAIPTRVAMINSAANSTLTATTSVLIATTSISTGNPIQNPPKALFASVQGNGGQLGYTYPITVAPGPSGTAPSLALNYSSGTTNARHAPTTPSGPAGEGWTLSLGEINAEKYPDGTTWYSISGVDNVSDRLIPSNATGMSDYFETQHISHLRIFKIDTNASTGQPCFNVWDTGGTLYEFGCTTNSLEYYIDSSGNRTNYAYALDKVTPPNEGSGTNNRTMVVTYVQDNETDGGHTWIRDFALKRITYGTTSNSNTTLAGTVDFFYNGPTAYTDSSNNVQYVTAYTNAYKTACNLPTTPPQIQRCDDPIDRTVGGNSYVDPDVMSTLELTSVKSYVGSDSATSHLDYSYALSYTDTAFGTCPGADTTLTNAWCAGNHLLTSVTPTIYQSGTGHAQAGITFGYSGARTNKYDDTSQSYHMENAWNYLTSYHDHSNGVGATSITYHTAWNNSNGTPYSSGDNRYDTLYCVWHSSDCTSSPWNPADNKMWNEQVVTQIVSQGKDSSASGISSDTTNYDYWLTKTGGTCSADSQGNTDCVGFGWMPNSGDTSSYTDFYHGEFRGFGTVLITSPAGDLTSNKYATTYGWNSSVTDARNYLAGSLLETDVYAGGSATCAKLISQIVNLYAGETAPTPTCSSSTFGSTTPTSCSSVYVKSPYTACEVALLSTRSTKYEQTGSAGSWVQHDYTYDDYRSTGGTTGLGSFYASPATGSYHNTQQEVITSSNAPTVTKNSTYYTTNTTVGGWTYYDVNKVAHSEVVDNSSTKWSCSDTTYDEGAASGVPIPDAGWPTTVKSYSTCGNSSTAITSYTGYDIDGSTVASIDSVGTANPSLYSSSGCTLSTVPRFLSTSWTAGRYTSCSAYSSANTQLTDTWNALSQHTSKAYDATQGLLSISATDVNSQTTTTSYSYDGSGNMIVQVKTPGELGSYTQQGTLKTSCTDSSTYPCLELDGNSSFYSSVKTQTFYDSMGRSVETLTPGPDSTHTTVSITVYNDAAHTVFTSVPFVVASRTTWLDPNGATDYNGVAPGGTTTTADALGRKLTVTDPLSHVTTTSYGLGTSGVSGDSNTYSITTVIDASSHEGKSYMDALARTIYTVAYSGLSTGTLTVVRRTTAAYNVLDKPTSMTVTDLVPQTGQSIISATTTATYDGLGRTVSGVDPDTGTTTNTYNTGGQLVGVTATSGSNTKVVGTKYDLLGRVGCVQDIIPASTDVSVTGACSSGVNSYQVNTYDTDPGGVTWGSTSYPIGKLTQSVTTTYYPGPDYAQGAVTENYQYDQRGQSVTKLLNMAVTGGSNVVFPTFPTDKVALAYNDVGQPTTTQTSVGGVTGYTFTQAYDSTTGVQVGLSNTSTASTSMAALNYNTNDLVSAITLKDSSGANLASENLLYDGVLRPASATTTWASGGSTIYSDAVSYDNLGNVLSRASTHAAVPGVTGSGGSETQNFCYDEQSQLVWASNATAATPATGQTCGTAALQSTLGSTYTNNYVYTHLGQLWQGPLNGSGAQEQYLYCNTSQPHQLTALSPISGSPTCASQGTTAYTASYDPWGNMTSRTYPTTTTSTPVYSTANQMIRWTSTTTTAANEEWYLYDASGNRVMRRSASTTSSGNPATAAATITVYAFGLEEHTYSYSGSGGSLTNTGNTYYYMLAGRLIGTSNGSSTSFVLTDLLGSVVSTISNTAGSAAVLGNQMYGPYGNQRYSAGSIATSKGFTGQYNDGLTGLDYYNARYYDPVIGLFTAADTVQGNAQGYDPYTYVSGNPETMGDPTGHCDSWCINVEMGSMGLSAIDPIVGISGLFRLAGDNLASHASTGNWQNEDQNWSSFTRGEMNGVAYSVAAIAAVVCVIAEPCGVSAQVGWTLVGIGFGTIAVNELSNGLDALNKAMWKAHPNIDPPPTQIHYCDPSICGLPRNHQGACNVNCSTGQQSKPVSTPTGNSPSGIQNTSYSHFTPPTYTKPVSLNTGLGSYTVASGDSLWAIAARFYGSGSQWQRLYQNNTGVVGGNPNLIYPGQRLRL